MSALRRDMIEAVESELRRIGATWERNDKSAHLKYRIVHDGKERLFVCAATPSDRRAHLNAITDLRKILGVKREVHKSKEPRRKRLRAKPPARVPEMPRVTMREDPFTCLSRVTLEPHHKPLGFATIGIDEAARRLADAILGE